MTAGQHLELGSEVAVEITTRPPGRSARVSPSALGGPPTAKGHGRTAPPEPSR